MKERKYKEEYKLETQLDVKTGKPKQIPVYMGDHYRLGEEKKGVALACILPLFAYLALYAAYMLLDSASARCIYVMPIAACATIPTLYALLGAVSALRAPEKMTRVQRETGVGRVMRSMMGCGVITALAVIGDAAFVLQNGMAGEGAAFALLVGASAAAWWGFVRSKAIYNGAQVIPGLAAKEAAKAAQKKASGEKGAAKA